MKDEEAIAAFAAFGNNIRFAVWRLLLPVGKAGMSASALAQRLGLSASNLAFHTRIMVEAGLMRQRRVQRTFVYAIDSERVGELAALLEPTAGFDRTQSEIGPVKAETIASTRSAGEVKADTAVHHAAITLPISRAIQRSVGTGGTPTAIAS